MKSWTLLGPNLGVILFGDEEVQRRCRGNWDSGTRPLTLWRKVLEWVMPIPEKMLFMADRGDPVQGRT